MSEKAIENRERMTGVDVGGGGGVFFLFFSMSMCTGRLSLITSATVRNAVTTASHCTEHGLDACLVASTTELLLCFEQGEIIKDL